MIDKTAEAIAARLRKMSELSAKEKSPMQRGVDMSADAIAARLREMANLSEACRKLALLRPKSARF